MNPLPGSNHEIATEAPLSTLWRRAGGEVMLQLFLGILFLVPFILSAQAFQLSGTIVNGEDDKPIEGASVFINNASGGTISNGNGGFTLQNISFNKFELVISHVSFETFVVPITPENIAKRFKIQLAPKQAELQGVTVGVADKRGWEKWGSVFTNSFIGTSDLAQNCTIKNPEVLKFYYSNATTVLRVIGTDKLIIENKKLGYTIHYQLEEFVYSRREGMTSYIGYTSFIPMQSASKRKVQNWRTERLEAYNGSLMHFMRSLYNNTIVADSFELRTLRRLYKADTATRMLYDSIMHGHINAVDTARYAVQLMKPSNSLQPAVVYIIGKNILYSNSVRRYDSVGKRVSFYCEDELLVRYKNEYEKPEYVGAFRKPQKERSILYFVKPEAVTVEENGLYFNPLNIFTEEYWAWEKTAEMLPADYKPEQ
jgi:hypothetical protein